jgi:hypothetical protein
MEIMTTQKAKKQIAARHAASFAAGVLAVSLGYGQAFADAATDLVAQAGSGGLASASTLMSSPAGTIIYLVVGFSILAFVVGIIMYIVGKGKR